MLTRDSAMHHSPGVWGLYAGGAVGAGMLVAVVVWNAIEYRAEILRWLKF